MGTPITTIRNLGPAMQQACRAAGINSAEDLHSLGADAAYAALIAAGTKPHFIGYCALAMGLQGRPWNDCNGQEKTDLRARFDAIKTSVHPDMNTKLERFLDEIGIRGPSR